MAIEDTTPPPLDPALRARLERRGARDVVRGWVVDEHLSDELATLGVEVVPYRIDPAAFRRYVRESGYEAMGYWAAGGQRAAVEKYLEHFVSLELLAIEPGDVVVDVASCTSPWPELVHQRFGCRVYRQDLSYPDGVDGDRIGGDAAAMPVDDGFADKLALHCSFEHFEEDRDSRFLREAGRVLRPGGRLCILPLYTNRVYSIQTDLEAWSEREPRLDPTARTHLAEDWGEVHGRFYDPRRFAERVIEHLGDLRLTLFRVENATEIDPACYLRLAAVLSKPRPDATERGPGPPVVALGDPDPSGHLERVHRHHAARIERLGDGLAAERRQWAAATAAYDEQIEKLRQGIDEQRRAREAVTARMAEDHARDRASYEAVIERLTEARRADAAAAEQRSLALAQREEEVERLGRGLDELIAERDRVTGELDAIHRSRFWRVWMFYLKLRRLLTFKR